MKTNNDWWKRAFGREYREFFEPIFPEHTIKEANFLIKRGLLKKTDDILDIPCGDGRQVIELTRRGYKVTGVDYSREFIGIAKNEAAKKGIVAAFEKADIRSVNLKKTFDVILVLGNSFGYFSDLDNKKTVKNLSKHLKQGGYLVLELPNALRIIKSIKGKGRRVEMFKVQKKQYRLREDYRLNPLTLTKSSHWSLKIEGKTSYNQRSKTRYYFFPEIRSLFEQYRLVVIKTFGSFDGKPYCLTSPRLIVIARKK